MSGRSIVIAVAAILTLGGAPAAAHGFTFRDAEFMPDDVAIDAARAFLAAALPPGLPLAEARARLTAAAMRCGRDDAPTTCDLGMLVHLDGGLLGEDHWRVRLLTDPAGRLAATTLDHYIVGTGVPGLN